MLALGIAFPVYFTKQTWVYLVFVYIFFASVTPIWVLKQPRDYLTTFLFIGMIVLLELLVYLYQNPTITSPAFTGFKSATGSYIFPTLFVTVACGAVSGFHSLVSSETSSKQIRNESDMLQVGYGSMLLESLLAVLVIVVVGSLTSLASKGVLNETLSSMAFADTATPFIKFSVGVTGLISQFDSSRMGSMHHDNVRFCFGINFIRCFVARIGRLSFQELFEVNEEVKQTVLSLFLTNKYVATLITLAGGYLLSLGGYLNIWPLFGSANQLLFCDGISFVICILKSYRT